ncbi:MAG: Sjogren's syndrome/scleroderma autoantigen 1 family protein, partial [Halobacteria archaeon]|nr:Sjogren's syndrome/scleroderma autoantigen 1 family protein [Halobacteria archaeon]
MLSEHCDECHNPMFRFRGEKVCAVCETKKAQEKKQRVEDEVEAGTDRTAETANSKNESRVS